MWLINYNQRTAGSDVKLKWNLKLKKINLIFEQSELKIMLLLTHADVTGGPWPAAPVAHRPRWRVEGTGGWADYRLIVRPEKDKKPCHFYISNTQSQLRKEVSAVPWFDLKCLVALCFQMSEFEQRSLATMVYCTVYIQNRPCSPHTQQWRECVCITRNTTF